MLITKHQQVNNSGKKDLPALNSGGRVRVIRCKVQGPGYKIYRLLDAICPMPMPHAPCVMLSVLAQLTGAMFNNDKKN